MQTDDKQKSGPRASLSRRTFLQFAAAGSAATLPAVAQAAVSCQDGDPQQLSDEEQVNACIAQLTDILRRMWPQAECKHADRGLQLRDDGSWRLSLYGQVQYMSFDGDGFYEVSVDGILTVYYLERDVQRRVSDGSPIPGSEFFWSYQWWDGEIIEKRRIVMPRIVRKRPDIKHKSFEVR
jgi:hypothetical protein